MDSTVPCPSDIAEIIDRSFTTLLEDLATGKSEHFLAYLAFSAKFHQYSSDNRRLIWEQCPDATRVAGYRKWLEEGYQVRKGEKGIRIKAPWLRKRKNSAGEDEQYLVGYLGVSVFDVSQLTEDSRPPEFFQKVYGDYDDLYTKAVLAASEEGIAIMQSSQTFGAQGYSAGGIIVLKKDMTSGNRVLTLFHEWGHELIHYEQEKRSLPKEVKECHAEATSFIVGSYFGVPAPYSSDYLINWGNTVDSLRQEMAIVQNAASHIITRINAVLARTATDLQQQQAS